VIHFARFLRQGRSFFGKAGLFSARQVFCGRAGLLW
jgi:hypothetical protein